MSVGSVTEVEQRTSGHSGGHRRTGYGKAGGTGKTASALCVMAAFLAFGIALITELVAYTRHESANPFFNASAGLLTVAAFGAGGYALMVQLRYWSQRVRRRLQVGLTVAVLTMVMVIANYYEPYLPSAGGQPDADPVKKEVVPVAPEDQSLLKPGWYGELQQDGVLAVISSFAENASESRQFNRRVAKPVSYAALSVINLGSPEPIILRSLQVGLVLDSGEEVKSLAVKPLMHPGPENEILLKRLVEPQTLAIGVMASDIPVCREPGFKWECVRGITVTFNARTVTIPGRMMTAEEKRALLERAAVSNSSSASTNRTAEAWFKGL